MGGDLDPAIANLLDDDLVAEVANTAFNLDLLLEELLEGGGVEDLVARGLLGVDEELEREVCVSAFCLPLSAIMDSGWRPSGNSFFPLRLGLGLGLE